LGVALAAAIALMSASSPAEAQQQCSCPSGSFSPQNNGQCFDNNSKQPVAPVCTSTSTSPGQNTQLGPPTLSEQQKRALARQEAVTAHQVAAETGHYTLIGDIIFFDAFGYDPTIDAASRRDRGSQVTSASGLVVQAPSSRTTDIAGVADGHVNTSKVFDLGYQRLTVGGVFRYDSLNRGYGTTPDLLALG
jgi:hypothetical protein